MKRIKFSDLQPTLVNVFFLLLIVAIALAVVLATRDEAGSVEGMSESALSYEKLDNFELFSRDASSLVGQKFEVEGDYLIGVRYCSSDYWTKHVLKDEEGNRVFFLPKDERSFKIGKEYSISGTFVKVTTKLGFDCYLFMED